MLNNKISCKNFFFFHIYCAAELGMVQFLLSSLQLAHMLQEWLPVHGAVSLILKPALQLLAVDIQKVGEYDLVEDFAAAHHLVESRTRADVHQQLPAHITWWEEEEEERSWG